MASVNLSAPWIRHYRKIEALFAQDDGVRVVYDNEDYMVKIYVECPAKAEAIETIIEPVVRFGNISLAVEVIPGNEEPCEDLDEDPVYVIAFCGNNAVSFVKTIEGIGDTPFLYVVFVPSVVQYFTDDIQSLYGRESTLYQEIAKDVLKRNAGVFFCTGRVPESDVVEF